MHSSTGNLYTLPLAILPKAGSQPDGPHVDRLLFDDGTLTPPGARTWPQGRTQPCSRSAHSCRSSLRAACPRPQVATRSCPARHLGHLWPRPRQPTTLWRIT